MEVAVSEVGDSIEITVEDDGHGIPPDRRERIFERFERGDATGMEGSGLGLSLVRQQARLHGGEVMAGESERGGARFAVHLRPGTVDGK